MPKNYSFIYRFKQNTIPLHKQHNDMPLPNMLMASNQEFKVWSKHLKGIYKQQAVNAQ